MEEQKGFLASLFDLSFSRLITTTLIKVLFVLGIVFSIIYAIIIVASGFGSSVGLGICALILSPLFFLLMVIMLRVWLELIVVMFRIEENTRPLRGEEKPGEDLR